MATVHIAGHEYETGGSILHPRNRYMKQFAEKFGKNKTFSFYTIIKISH